MSETQPIYLVTGPETANLLRAKLLRLGDETPRDKSPIYMHRASFSVSGIAVIASPFLNYQRSPPPPSILHDFDRWFAAALSRVTWRKIEEEERRLQNLKSAWRE